MMNAISLKYTNNVNDFYYDYAKDAFRIVSNYVK